MSKSIKCPHCAHEFHVALKAAVPDTQRLTMCIEPNSSGMFEARTLGDTINNFSKVLKAVGKDLGSPLSVMVESLKQHENGRVDIGFLVVDQKQKPAQQAAQEGGEA